MTMHFASRHVPTLTEALTPAELAAIAPLPHITAQASPEPKTQDDLAEASAVPDAQGLAQQILQQLGPQLEAQLHSTAQEWLQARLNAMLPELRLHLQASVHQAVEQALADPRNRNV